MDREKVIERIHEAIDMGVCVDLFMDILILLKEQKAQKFFVDESGKITPLPVVVRCKDCKFQVDRGRRYPECDKHFLWAKDNWFCADGERREGL